VEIARRFGMPERVITFARQMLGNAGSEFAGLLTELRQKRQEFENLRTALDERERSLEQRSADLDARADDVLQIRKEAAEKGWSDAKELISATRRRTNALLDELKFEKRNDIIQRIRRAEAELTEQLKPKAAQAERLALTSVAPGDAVRINSLGYDAVVLSLDSRHTKARVRAGRMELDVLVADLSAPLSAAGSSGKKSAAAPWKMAVVESDRSELKLIGMRVGEALAELEPFINHAHAAGLQEVRIIHGLGTGKLRNAVREELERHPLVAEFRPGEPHEGRDGATVVMLREQ
jgi:DNA mismatch repair protein MutS2